MYIEDRLFSETSDEVLYSVTMTEEEYSLYSEFLEVYKQRLYSKSGEIIKTLRKSKKAAKKAWENAGADSVLVGPQTVGQFRKINASGITLTKHELKGGIGAPTRIHNGRKVHEINLAPSSPTNQSINAKGIQKAIYGDTKGIMEMIHKDPKKGEYTRIRWNAE